MKKGAISLLILGVMFTGVNTTYADIFTASNPAEFETALGDAEDGNNRADIIQLQDGCCDLAGWNLRYEVNQNGPLTIQPHPGNSFDVVLDGGSGGVIPLPPGVIANQILEITDLDDFDNDLNEFIRIEGITFQNAIGTALTVTATDIEIVNSRFIDNAPDFSLSPSIRLGGGAVLQGKSVTLENNRFDGNFGAPDMCGGVLIAGRSVLVNNFGQAGPIRLDSNIFVGNSGGGPYFSLGGGGACIRPANAVGGTTTLTNNVFDANTCSEFLGCPGGLEIGNTSAQPHTVTVTNNTFINNEALQSGAYAGAVIQMLFADINVYNNIFWNNLDSSPSPVPLDLVVSEPDNINVSTDVLFNLFTSGAVPGTGGSAGSSWLITNLDSSDSRNPNKGGEDPILDASYHLPVGASPAKDYGDSNAPGIPALDFEGDIRGSGSAVDSGADEFAPPTPDIAVSPTSLAFPDTVVPQSPAPLDVTVSNNGTADLFISVFSLDDTTNFSISSGTCSVSLAPLSSCVATVTFRPQSVAAFSASLTVVSNDPDTPNTVVPLSGNGVSTPAPDIDVDRTSITFPDIVVSPLNESSPEVITISNTGSGNLNIDNIALVNGNDFTLDPGSCGTEFFTIIPGANCTVSVVFAPQTVASGLTDTLRIISDDPDENPLDISLSGNGTAAPAPNIQVVPSSFDFGEVVENQSTTTTVTVSNIGNLGLAINGIALDTGAEFSLDTGNCGSTLAAGENCTITITFSPTAGGVFNDTLTIDSTDPDSPIVDVNVTGTGLADSDGDGVPDRDDASPNDATVATPPAATGTGNITISTSSGTLSQVHALLDTDVNQDNRPTGVSFPDGLVSFQVVGLMLGETITIDIVFPTAFPASGARYFLADANGFTELLDVEFNGNVARLTKTDGGNGDLDGVENGEITDPSGWAESVLTDGGSGGGGCFIATAAYGSYLDPHVKTLRRFRDQYLLTNVPGEWFVRIYYQHSPPIADYIRERETLKTIVRSVLTVAVYSIEYPVVAGLVLLLPPLMVIRQRKRRKNQIL
jgi:hypothetical protein